MKYRRCRVAIAAVEKDLLFGINECASVFLPWLSGMPIASFLRNTILPSVACLALSCFPTLSHKLHDFREVVIGRIKRVLIFSTTFV
jgi:hypothetical protein